MNKYDCSNVCAGNNYNANGCCDDEVPDCLNDCNGNYEELVYDSNQDGNFDAVCNCLETLSEDGCCCDEIRDCAGICDGNSVEDNCNICNGDSTTCAGCDGVPNSGLTFDCLGICGGTEVDADYDGICDYEDDCIDTAEVCGEILDSGCGLPINNIYLSENQVWYNLDFITKGFQFNIVFENVCYENEDYEGETGSCNNLGENQCIKAGCAWETAVIGASGGDAEISNFTVSGSESTVLGFSFSGASIQAGCGTLTELILNGDGTAIELINIIFTDFFDEGVDFVEYYNP